MPPYWRRVREAVEAAGEELVAVGLVADVPDDAVARRLELRVEGDRELHGPQARPEVAAGLGHRVDDRLAHLGASAASCASLIGEVVAREAGAERTVGHGHAGSLCQRGSDTRPGRGRRDTTIRVDARPGPVRQPDSSTRSTVRRGAGLPTSAAPSASRRAARRRARTRWAVPALVVTFVLHAPGGEDLADAADDLFRRHGPAYEFLDRFATGFRRFSAEGGPGRARGPRRPRDEGAAASRGETRPTLGAGRLVPTARCSAGPRSPTARCRRCCTWPGAEAADPADPGARASLRDRSRTGGLPRVGRRAEASALVARRGRRDRRPRGRGDEAAAVSPPGGRPGRCARHGRRPHDESREALDRDARTRGPMVGRPEPIADPPGAAWGSRRRRAPRSRSPAPGQPAARDRASGASQRSSGDISAAAPPRRRSPTIPHQEGQVRRAAA